MTKETILLSIFRNILNFNDNESDLSSIVEKDFIFANTDILTYDKIYERLWEYGEEPSAGSLRAYVQTVRSFLGKENIETIKNIGYRFVKE